MPAEDSEELKYLRERRKELGGSVPSRHQFAPPLEAPALDEYAEFFKGSGDRAVSTTMAFVRVFGKLLRHPTIGKLIVPIVPDEARTFGMEALFRQFGIYSHCGQNYEPVDSDTLLYYREAKDGQILEEGITEAGSMASFIAAGTSYATHSVNTIPFFIYYSMFGFQRIGDLIWLAADSRCKGFLLGGTAGRTTLNGEGLQHQDGHSHLLAATVPNLVAYDPAYAYETAVIVQDGIRRMYQEQESIFYYVTLYNENYEHPEMPSGVTEGILSGMYRLKSSTSDERGWRPQLLGSGPILREVLRAQEILESKVQGADGRLERHELQRVATGCAERRALESTSPDREATVLLPLRHLATPGRPLHRRERLHALGSGADRAVGTGRPHDVGDRWVRPQRVSRGAPRILRGQRGVHRHRYVERAGRTRRAGP